MLKNLFFLKIFRSINYFGHRVKLRRTYFSEIAYTLDPNNISMEEACRLEKIIKSLPFGPVFNSKDEIIHSLVGIRFPGYGSFYANQLNSEPEQRLELMSVVIPRTGKYRYFVIEAQSNVFSVVADFIAEARGVTKVRKQGCTFEFLSRSNEVIFVEKRSPLS